MSLFRNNRYIANRDDMDEVGQFDDEDMMGADPYGDFNDFVGAVAQEVLARAQVPPAANRGAMLRPGAMRQPMYFNQAPPVLVQRPKGPEDVKVYSLPLSQAVGTTTAAAASAQVSTRAERKFRVERFGIDSVIAPSFTVEQVTVGVNPQLASLGSMPGSYYSALAVNTSLRGDLCGIGQAVSVNFTNISAGALRFLAGCNGATVR